MDEIYIERMVIDLPGLTTAQAQELSHRVGDGLAAAAGHEGIFPSLTVDLNEPATSRDLPRLAEAIVNSLLRQIG